MLLGRHNIEVFGFQPEIVEDEDGMMKTVQRVQALIEEEIKEGIPISRILLIGFSQGGAMGLLAAIVSKLSIGGVASMSGWIPLNKKIEQVCRMVAETRSLYLQGNIGGFEKIAANPIRTMPIFWSHGTEDRNVPSEYKAKSLQILKGLVSDERRVEVYIYKKMHHMCDEEVQDLLEWMNRLIPKAETCNNKV